MHEAAHDRLSACRRLSSWLRDWLFSPWNSKVTSHLQHLQMGLQQIRLLLATTTRHQHPAEVPGTADGDVLEQQDLRLAAAEISAQLNSPGLHLETASVADMGCDTEAIGTSTDAGSSQRRQSIAEHGDDLRQNAGLIILPCCCA